MENNFGNFSQKLCSDTDYPDETLITIRVLSTKNSPMNQVDRIETIIRGALETCPMPQQGETLTATLTISELKLTIDRRRNGEPAAEEQPV